MAGLEFNALWDQNAWGLSSSYSCRDCLQQDARSDGWPGLQCNVWLGLVASPIPDGRGRRNYAVDWCAWTSGFFIFLVLQSLGFVAIFHDDIHCGLCTALH
eukprot:664502-Pelagomonas_calceolata.AAC.10